MVHCPARPCLATWASVLFAVCLVLAVSGVAGGRALAAPAPELTCPSCNDNDACTVDSCDTTTGTCRHDPVSCDDGNPCTADNCNRQFRLGIGCTNFVVAAGTGCDDGISCTQGDACDSSGHCTGTPVPPGSACHDGNSCTTDETCASDGQCAGTPLTPGSRCDDATLCTSNDTCVASGTGLIVCQGTLEDCSDGNLCTQDLCDFSTGACSNPPVDCNDGNVCTADSCDPATGTCLRSNVTGPCYDNNGCTQGDACSGGNCIPGTLPCDDGVACTDDYCDPYNEHCSHVPVDSRCTTTNPCERGSCTSFGCLYRNKPGTCNYSVCTDGLCQGGMCLPTVSKCESFNLCIDDFCSATGSCSHTYNSAPCNDGNPCTAGDTCANGSCQPGAPAGLITCGVGTCQRTVDACVNGVPQTCVPGTPSHEVCDNGIDDDCNGLVDDIGWLASCSINPTTLNLGAQGNAFSFTCSLIDVCHPGVPLSLKDVVFGPAYVSRADRASDSSDDVILPDPATLACPDPVRGTLFERGIVENVGQRDVSVNNVTFHFNQPGDGDCTTLDGDRQDLLGRLTAVPDGNDATICISGKANGRYFAGCTAATIRNKGNH